MTRTARRAALPAVLCLSLLLGGCSSGSGNQEATATSATTSSETESQPVSDEPFGAGCAGLPAEGAGSIAGMVDAPLFEAVTANPELTTFAQAVISARLDETLNSTANITVLAPTEAAFAAVPPEQLQALLADSAQLTATLVHHVVPGRLGPDDLAGTHTTLNNDELTVEGVGEAFTIPAGATLLHAAAATVLCGNLQTANATVYLIDQVLTPTG